MVASGGVLSEGCGHGGPVVCLGDDEAEAEEIPSLGVRGDTLLRLLPPYLTYSSRFGLRWRLNNKFLEDKHTRQLRLLAVCTPLTGVFSMFPQDLGKKTGIVVCVPVRQA